MDGFPTIPSSRILPCVVPMHDMTACLIVELDDHFYNNSIGDLGPQLVGSLGLVEVHLGIHVLFPFGNLKVLISQRA